MRARQRSLAARNREADAGEIAIGDTRSFTPKPQSYGLKKLPWHRPLDVVAGATGQGDVDETGCGDPPSAAPSCDTSPKLSETMNLQVNVLDGGGNESC